MVVQGQEMTKLHLSKNNFNPGRLSQHDWKIADWDIKNHNKQVPAFNQGADKWNLSYSLGNKYLSYLLFKDLVA